MLARNPKWTFDDAGFAADVAVLKALARDMRLDEDGFRADFDKIKRLARDLRRRELARENTMQSLEDYDLADGDRPANRRRS